MRYDRHRVGIRRRPNRTGRHIVPSERSFQVGSILVELIAPKSDDPREFKAHFSREGSVSLDESPFEYGRKDLEFLSSAVEKAKKRIDAATAGGHQARTELHNPQPRNRPRRSAAR